MSELAVIQETLRRAAFRRRLDRGLRGLWLGLLVGCAAWLLGLGLHRVAPIPDAIAEWGWIAALGAGLAGFLRGFWKPVPLATAARLVESRQRLDQRVSTALELAGTGPDRASEPSWVRLVVADAHRALQGLDLARLLPFQLTAPARWIPVLLVAVIGLGFVPPYRSASHLQRKKDAEVIREAGRRVAQAVRQELQRPEKLEEPARETLENLAQLGDRLSQAKLTKAEALKDLANAAARLEQETKQMDAQPVLRKLQQAARTPSGAGSAPGNPALQKQLEKMQQNLGSNPPDALDQLARKLEEARQMAAGAQGNTPENAAQQQALGQALQQLAQSASQMGLDLAGLNQALDALKDLDFDRVMKDLEMAGANLDKLRDMAQKLAEMQQSMQQMGKDLAEQLERGQAENAAQTLEKMAEQLRTSNLTPDQKQAMMAEVAKALKPASEYGDVSKLLEKASQQMGSEQNGQAAQNLADAAKELRKMADEAQQMQMMAQAMDALQNAQMAIASGRGWKAGQCQGGACTGCSKHPNGRISWGKGGKPSGFGVGTWADENNMFTPEITERWDNSGVKRPDMAARGHTDRGDGKLSDSLAPTKLQGQFTPGPMPSITLKGVNIKGQSTVQYQQAVESAQSDAQSALNQDQVPRAYRGAVKGYFDDLK